jgi:hypothetical protein
VGLIAVGPMHVLPIVLLTESRQSKKMTTHDYLAEATTLKAGVKNRQ